ncbi:glycosyltransferase [Photobacterium chitinilyticum]|uniref:glycosyltransferase n=1 Tax=Photobacterium chitinilyticum TaxID=2485123 RepID=UPI003D13E2C7
MKKIGYIIPNLSTLSETFVSVEMRAMMALGHQIKPYAFDTNEQFQPADAYLKHRCTYLSTAPKFPYLNIWKAYRCHSFIIKQQEVGYISLLHQGLQLAYLAEKDGCEHFHVHLGWHSAAIVIVAAKILNIPVSFAIHNANLNTIPQDLSHGLQAADFICSATKKMQNELRLATQQPVHHIPFGVNEADYSSLTQPWRPHKDFLLFGQLLDKKGLSTLLIALQQLEPTTTLDIVGDGPHLSPLKQQINKLGLCHQITFFKSKQPSWYRRFACQYKALVVPFTATNQGKDTSPLIITEAMALGLPVITSDLLDYREILDDESGHQVSMDEPYALAHAMQSHLSSSFADLNLQRAYAFNRVMTLFTASRQADLLSKKIEAL